MQTLPRLSPQSADGVFHRYSEFRKSAFPQFPYRTVSTRSASLPRAARTTSQDFTLLPAAPYQTATSPWTSGVMVHFIHSSMQFGCGAFAEIIHVSAQPVAPSEGITESTGASASAYDRLMGQAVPTTMLPFTNPSISSV